MPVPRDLSARDPYHDESGMSEIFDDYFGGGWRDWITVWDAESGGQGGDGEITTVSELIVHGGSFQTDSGGWFVGVSLESVAGVLATVSGVTYFLPGGQGISGGTGALAGIIAGVTIVTDFNYFPIYTPGAADGWYGI